MGLFWKEKTLSYNRRNTVYVSCTNYFSGTFRCERSCPLTVVCYVEHFAILQLKDYSGKYHVKLIPCTATLNQPYSVPVVCNPGQPVTFDLPIRFQQITDPVPAEYSLDTKFRLMRKRDLWLSDTEKGLDFIEDSSFAPGECLMVTLMKISYLNHDGIID